MKDDLRILFPSDWHLGHEVGFCFPEVIINEGTPREYTINASNLQTAIHDGAMDVLKEIGKIDVLVLNGDLVDGVNKHSEGYGIWSCTKEEQIRQAVKFGEIIKKMGVKEIYGTKGSAYHCGDNICADLEVVQRLGGKFKTSHFLTFRDVNFNVAHKIGYTKNDRTKSNAAMAELAAAVSNEKVYGNVDVIVRSHVHYFAQASYDDKTCFTTPALKARDDYAETGGLGMAPRFGMIYVDVNHGDWHVEPVLFQIPTKYYAEWIESRL